MPNPVLSSAYQVAQLSQNVTLARPGIASAATKLLANLIETPYTTSDWSLVPLHPTPSLHPLSAILDWIFLVSSLNFSFWSDLPTDSRYGVRWKSGTDGKGVKGEEKVWTGYWSLLAALHRAREEGIDVTSPAWYKDATDEQLRRVFRSDQEEGFPLLEKRIAVMREVGNVLCESFGGSYANLLAKSNRSALALVDLVVTHFPCYDDRTTYPASGSRDIVIRKRAQILVAETWAAFDGKGPGRFEDINELTMFADYRVPQILHSLQTLTYSPHLTSLLLSHADLPNGSPEEVEIRCLSIVAVEEIRLEMVRLANELGRKDVKLPNAALLDFLLWDLAQVEEANGNAELPHHRTRSVFY